MRSQELSKEALLTSLGASNDFIFEVIVSTCSTDGIPNVAPMGIQFVGKTGRRGENDILLKPFKSTATYHNLSTQREAVINVTSDPAIFYDTAFKRQAARASDLKVALSASKKVRPPRVLGCDAYIEVTVEKLADLKPPEKERGEVRCHIELIHLQNPGGRLYCRAPHVLIEAIVHATRVNELRSQGLAKEAGELVGLIDRYRKLIHKVAPSSKYEVMADELIIISGREK